MNDGGSDNRKGFPQVDRNITQIVWHHVEHGRDLRVTVGQWNVALNGIFKKCAEDIEFVGSSCEDQQCQKGRTMSEGPSIGKCFSLTMVQVIGRL